MFLIFPADISNILQKHGIKSLNSGTVAKWNEVLISESLIKEKFNELKLFIVF